MLFGDVHRHSIQLLFNYWEIPPSQMGARLDEWLRRGVTHFVSFVPWQAFESDISHSLHRFLQSLAERKMTVSLILTPELGVHYPCSGVPKELFAKPENIARHHRNGVISSVLPPQLFHLPSFLSPEFQKRYQGFLSRMDAFFAALSRTNPEMLAGVAPVLTGSFWKYYRVPKDSHRCTFGGMAGDYSSFSGIAFRQFQDLYYSQKEFLEPNPAVAHRWKSQAVEDLNRRLFYQHSEDLFRTRSTQVLRRKALPLEVMQLELFTPEADPAFCYSAFFHFLSGAKADFARLSGLLDEMALRSSFVCESQASPFVHWTGFGPFHSLSDSEKQFLLLKSLLLFGGQGGGILVDEREWLSLSLPFRTRAEVLARQLTSGELRLQNRVLFLTSHLWSDGGDLLEELQNKGGFTLRVVSSVEAVLRDTDAELVVVDPAFVLTHEVTLKLLHWAARGGGLALPRSPFYTEAGRAAVEKLLGSSDMMEVSVGLSYRVLLQGSGKVVFYDLPSPALGKKEAMDLWRPFIRSLLSLFGIDSPCSLTDDRLKALALGSGLFILNGSGRALSASVVFPEEVRISDWALTSNPPSFPSKRFTLDVPPCGVLPLRVMEEVEAERGRTQVVLESPPWKKAETEKTEEEVLSPWN